MSFKKISSHGMNTQERYLLLLEQLKALTQGERHTLANLANAAALIYHSLPQLNWAGFYLLEGQELILGPFNGLPACIRIPLGKGVCGTAVQENRTLRVEDVHKFPGHIPCDSASNSEIVIPLRQKGSVVGVLDLDSPEFNRFSPEDRHYLELFVKHLEEACDFKINWQP